MYVEIVPNRKARPTVLLRIAWREGKKVRKKTLANLTDWPEEKIQALRDLLKDKQTRKKGDTLIIERSLPCGHIRAILQVFRKSGLDSAISPKPSIHRRIAMAMVVEELLGMHAPGLASSILDETSIAYDLDIAQMTMGMLNDTHDYLDGAGASIINRLEEHLPSMHDTIREPAHIAYNSQVHTLNDQGSRGIVMLIAHALSRHMSSALSPILVRDSRKSSHSDYSASPTLRNTIGRFSMSKDSRGDWENGLSGIISHLSTQVMNICRTSSSKGGARIIIITTPTPLQLKAQELLERYGTEGVSYTGLKEGLPKEPSGNESGFKPIALHGDDTEAYEDEPDPPE
ncbi:MAG TPA: hypothetical protein VMU10_10865 [Desulfomonilia bacterium]|nr:hypothetical protein [Desulfomonilia bacterium]